MPSNYIEEEGTSFQKACTWKATYLAKLVTIDAWNFDVTKATDNQK